MNFFCIESRVHSEQVAEKLKKEKKNSFLDNDCQKNIARTPGKIYFSLRRRLDEGEKFFLPQPVNLSEISFFI